MEKDESLIPRGEYCYRIIKIAKGEALGSDDLDRFGKELREVPYHGEHKEVLCPYWIRTDYGTVKCDFLGKEVVEEEEDNATERIKIHFGHGQIPETIGYSWKLSDEIKICGVNSQYDEEDEGMKELFVD
jgi:hypothetical protein